MFTSKVISALVKQEQTNFEKKTAEYKYIRKMHNADIEFVARLIQRLRKPLFSWLPLGKILESLLPDKYSRLEMDELFLIGSLADVHQTRSIIRVFEKDKVLHGFAWGKIEEGSWLIHNIVVDPRSENKKIGTALFYDLFFSIAKKDPPVIGIYATHPAMEKIISHSGLFCKIKARLHSVYGKASYWEWKK